MVELYTASIGCVISNVTSPELKKGLELLEDICSCRTMKMFFLKKVALEMELSVFLSGISVRRLSLPHTLSLL